MFSNTLSNRLRFIHTGLPGSLAACFPLQWTHNSILCGHFLSFPHSLHSCLGLRRNVCGAGAMYAPSFAAAAARWLCEFVSVEVPVDSSRLYVVSGVAVLASEAYAEMGCVCLVAEGDHYRRMSTLSKVLRAMSIGGGSASIYAVALVEFLFDFCRGHRFALVAVYGGALDDYLVSLRVELCVKCVRW